MTEREYRQKPGISRTELWRLRDSPEKFKYWKEHPEAPTQSLIFGQAVHKLLLEPDGFDQEFAVIPEIDRRTKDGKAAYEAFLGFLENRQAIPRLDYEKAIEMAKKAKETQFVARLLDGEHERPIFWTDELTGEPCKARLDVRNRINGRTLIVDYKTTQDASTESFMRSAIKYGYDMQAAMYSDGEEHETGEKPIFVFIAQEKDPPYSVNILQADEIFVKRGYDIFRELLGIYHECKKTDNWYGYLGAYGIINNLALPAWLAKEIE